MLQHHKIMKPIINVLVYFSLIEAALAGTNSERVKRVQLESPEIGYHTPLKNFKGKKHSVISGTGFYVDQNRLLTNAHVVKSCGKVIVRSLKGTAEATVTHLDRNKDLALIETSLTSDQIAGFEQGVTLKNASKLRSFGFPLSQLSRTAKMKQLAVSDNQPGIIRSDRVTLNAASQNGESGAPVVNPKGRVIGMIAGSMKIKVADLSNRSIAGAMQRSHSMMIKPNTIKSFLNQAGLKTKTLDNQTPAVHAKTIQSFTTNIRCVN